RKLVIRHTTRERAARHVPRDRSGERLARTVGVAFTPSWSPTIHRFRPDESTPPPTYWGCLSRPDQCRRHRRPIGAERHDANPSLGDSTIPRPKGKGAVGQTFLSAKFLRLPR